MTAKRTLSTRWRVVALCMMAMAVLTVSCSTGSRPTAAPQTRIVEIRASKFVPDTLTVNVGDTVEFKNSDIVPHTATTIAPAVFDSGRIGVGKSWKYAAGKKGVYEYECSFHPNMQGKIVVQ